MGLFADWCGKKQIKDKQKHFLTFAEKGGGRDAIRDRLCRDHAFPLRAPRPHR